MRGTNAAPSGNDFTTGTQRGVDLTFAYGDFQITDSDDDPLKEIQLVTLPDAMHGVLKLDGTTIAARDLPQTVSQTELEAGKLVFSSVAEGDATFTFRVVDSFDDASASANTATITVSAGPPLMNGVAHGRRLVLVYEQDLDEDSTPAAGDFTVKIDGSEVSLANRNPVVVSGNTVTLNLASAVTAGQRVTVSYTKGTNPIRNVDGDDAVNLVGRRVGATPLTVQRAVINRAGTAVTIQLSETMLQGEFNRLNWTYRVDGVNRGNPDSGAFDADQGTITLNLSPAVNVELKKGGTPVTVNYRRSNTPSARIRDHAGEELASFSRRQLGWYIPSGACTKGPGPDPFNPDGPCGSGPDDRPENYKSIGDLTEAELDDPPHPPNVQINCTDPDDPTDCTITWDQVSPDDWGGHIYKVYLFADFDQTAATCTTGHVVVQSNDSIPHHGTLSFQVSLTPRDIPTGCTLEQWIAAVSVELTGSGKVSRSGNAFHGQCTPPQVRLAPTDGGLDVSWTPCRRGLLGQRVRPGVQEVLRQQLDRGEQGCGGPVPQPDRPGGRFAVRREGHRLLEQRVPQGKQRGHRAGQGRAGRAHRLGSGRLGPQRAVRHLDRGAAHHRTACGQLCGALEADVGQPLFDRIGLLHRH